MLIRTQIGNKDSPSSQCSRGLILGVLEELPRLVDFSKAELVCCGCWHPDTWQIQHTDPHGVVAMGWEGEAAVPSSLLPWPAPSGVKWVIAFPDYTKCPYLMCRCIRRTLVLGRLSFGNQQDLLILCCATLGVVISAGSKWLSGMYIKCYHSAV